MRADEYLRLRVACLAMAGQSQTLDVRVRWVKLADAASVAANTALVVARELERKIPVATRARFPNRTSESGWAWRLRQTKSPVERQLAGPS